MPDLSRPPADAVPDAVLLARFVRERDEAAFELLVWRHRRLVFDTARRVVGNRADAEDAAQAAFLVLARKADRVGANVAGWLYTVAYRCAARVRRKASGPRQRAGGTLHPQEDFLTGEGSTGPLTRAARLPEHLELLAALDDELARLPDLYRTPLVLCYLHGLTYPEAAARLGCPVGTLSGRLARGKERLRQRLVRRGVAAVALPAVLDALPASADLPRTAAITKAAVAFLAGEPVPTAALANGVLRAMTLNYRLLGFALSVAAVVAAAGTLTLAGRVPDDPPKPPAAKPMKTDRERMQGEWVFAAAAMPGGADALTWVWESRLIVAGDSMAITKYKVPYTEQVVPELKTTFTLDPAKTPTEIDLAIPALATMVFGKDVAGGPIRGVYRFDDDDTLTLCLADRPRFPRPTVFDAKERERFLFTMKRSQQPGAATPKTATLRLLDPDGKPLPGAVVSTGLLQNLSVDQPPELLAPADRKFTTGADGRATVEVRGEPIWTVWHPDRQLIARTVLTPAGLLHDSVQTVRAVPAGRVTVPVRCPDLAGRPAAPGVGGAHLLTADGEPVGYSVSAKAEFRFVVPPGAYTLRTSGTYWRESEAGVTVRPGESALDPVPVPPNKLGQLLGKPAPELANVQAWKGPPTTLAGLKGKPVLLVWFRLDQLTTDGAATWLGMLNEAAAEYKDRGLEVLLAAVDADGKVTTAEQFDAAVKWAMKDRKEVPPVPARVAVLHDEVRFSGPNTPMRGHPSADAYGANGPFHPVLIDREGKVVGVVFPRLTREQKELFDKVVGGK